MNAKISLLVIFCAFLAFAVLVAGFVLSGGDDAGSTVTPTAAPEVSPTPAPGDQGTGPVVITQSPTPTPGNGGTSATSTPTPTPIPTPTPAPGTNQTIGTPTPTPTLVPTPTPVPVWSATTSDWGSDKDTYARGSMATGWVYVTNTGNVPITQIDFAIVIKRTIFFYTMEKYFPYNATGLSIQPGVKQQVAFSITIPAEYQGLSTAGDYQLTTTAFLSGKNIGSFSKNIKVV